MNKQCKGCEDVLPITSFYKHRHINSFGQTTYHPRCKACFKSNVTARRAFKNKFESKIKKPDKKLVHLPDCPEWDTPEFKRYEALYEEALHILNLLPTLPTPQLTNLVACRVALQVATSI
jgi:hypothetical protein